MHHRRRRCRCRRRRCRCRRRRMTDTIITFPIKTIIQSQDVDGPFIGY